MSSVIFLSDVRLSFPTIVEARPHAKPSSSNPAPLKYYSTDVLLAPDDPQWNTCWEQIVITAQEKWAEHAGAILEACNADRKSRAWGKGSEKISRKTMQPYEGYGSNLYITLNRLEKDGQPQMIKPDGNAANPTDTLHCQTIARQFYGGCRANVAMRFWPQDNDNGRAVRAELIAVQFARDDEPFGEAVVDASGMFGSVGKPAEGAAPAGAPLPQTPTGFGQAQAPADDDMPEAPFPAPGLPSFFG